MAEITTDHDTVRKWAESKGGKPAAVGRTHAGGDVGIIRIMFPDNAQSEHGSLVEISWEEFFRQFEESRLALLYEEGSLFSKIVGRDTVERRQHGDHDGARSHAGGPDTGGQTGSGREQGGSPEERSLQAREYRDKDGTVHHHTRRYMEQHGGGQDDHR
jgi:hypothetical protein